MKKLILTICATGLLTASFAQLQLNTAGTPATVDFTGFDGSGFDAAPAAGQLDSDDWSVLGLNDGDLLFGGTQTGNDFALGVDAGGTTQGGLYAFDDNGDICLGVQPAASDFTPGTFILRVQNNTGAAILSLNITYDIKSYNDQDRSSSMNFAHSGDNMTYTPEPSADFASAEVGSGSPTWVTESRTINISGLNLANGDFYYLSWNSDDVSGSGSRDELGIDNITVTGNVIGITGTGSNGCVGEAINFASSVNGGAQPFTYLWDFNGEGTDNVQNPTFTFNTPGMKTIDVFVEDANGDIASHQFTIQIYDNPQAAFTASTTSGCADLDVTFTDNSTAPGGQTITNWNWDFDNTNSSTNQAPPQETFTAGTYNVTLEVTTDQGCTDLATETITVTATEDASFSYGASTYCNQDANPTPTITGVTGGTFSSTTGLTINASTGEIDLANSTVGNYTVTYTTPGTCSGTETFDVEVTGVLDATISGATDLCEDDDPLMLTAADAGGTWSASCGTCIDANTGEFDPSASGTGMFTVDYVISGNCGDNDQVTITVNPSPTASFTYTGETLNGGEVSFTNTSTGAVTYSWNFDDGNSSTDENPTNTYASGGTYNVCLEVESADGCIDETCANITVDTDNASSNSFSYNQVSVYPNPVTNQWVNIDANGYEYDVEIVDLTGKVITTSKDVNGSTQIDLSAQAKGVYFIKVSSANHTFSYKLIKH